MSKTIDEGFRTFLGWLTPTSTESNAAQTHRASIEACLKANFDMKRFFRSGSFGNGTSIYGYSDVDYFAEIPTEKLKQNSDSSLKAVRDALDKRFPNTGVRVSCPAVIVPFGTNAKETTEVVPADYVKKTSDGYTVYEIADSSGDWMHASPEAHKAYIRTVDDKLGGKVKPLIRFIKAWKFYQNVPISSFYLELRVAKYAEGENVIVYDIDVKNIFALLDSNGLASIRDPQGISGLISACSTETKLTEAKSKVATALSRAKKAREAAAKENIEEAFEWWDLLYKNHFPSYNT